MQKTKYDVFLKELLPNGYFYQKLTNPNHQDSCDCSCYDCLRDYYNQRYHEMLDWRLGLDLTKIASDKQFVPEFMDKNGYWRPLLEKRLEAISKQGTDKVTYKAEIETSVLTINEEKVLFIHPFWSELKIQTLCQKYECNLDNVVYINKFIQNLRV